MFLRILPYPRGGRAAIEDVAEDADEAGAKAVRNPKARAKGRARTPMPDPKAKAKAKRKANPREEKLKARAKARTATAMATLKASVEEVEEGDHDDSKPADYEMVSILN
eukprot:TRINITY_DN20968_c0_g1_i1.p2 TRINITY_DN20968_c0_g1~~TRINITY_DN20968_c0_g1_i1.p2  ORF type:complete len:109 (+),score=10.29 TRINITY_DN20968_c0_g1_i1:156-482(+)